MKTEDGLCERNWTILPEASKICYELVSCGCKKGCVSRGTKVGFTGWGRNELLEWNVWNVTTFLK